MSTWRERRLARKIRRAEDNLADLEERLWKWGFGMIPSEKRAHEERIEKAKEKLEALLARQEDCSREDLS